MSDEIEQGESPNQPKTAAPAPSAQAQSGFRFRLIDARPPYQDLAYLALPAIPRPGDHINIQISTGKALFRVDFVNFEPASDFPVLIGCSPFVATPPSVANDNLKQRMDDFVKNQLQLFDRGESYSKALILLGFAGTFAIWNFAKDVLTNKAGAVSAILIGISLLVYVTFEVITMIYRSMRHNDFIKLIHNNPTDFFSAVDKYNVIEKAARVRNIRAWVISLIVTLLFGYAGALLLLYNCLAKLTGLPPYP